MVISKGLQRQCDDVHMWMDPRDQGSGEAVHMWMDLRSHGKMTELSSTEFCSHFTEANHTTRLSSHPGSHTSFNPYNSKQNSFLGQLLPEHQLSLNGTSWTLPCLLVMSG